MPCPRPESVGAHKLSSGSAKHQLSVRITLTMARAFTQCAYLLCRTCYISYLYVMYGYTCYGYKVLVYMAILTVYSLPYELQACAGAQVLYLLLYGCTCTSMMLLFYRMHNGCEYSFHGYTHELRDARGRRRPGNLNPQLVPRTLWYEWLRR